MMSEYIRTENPFSSALNYIYKMFLCREKYFVILKNTFVCAIIS